MTAVVGLGIIGGSLLRRLGATAVGYDTDPLTRAAARAAGCDVADSLDSAVAGQDLVVVAVPIPAIGDLLARLEHDVLVTDVASVKAPVAALAAGRRYVGGHPMAGTEHPGFAASDPDLFTGAPWALCLDADTDLADWLRVAALVTGVGARAVPLTAAAHDRAVARISHLPHVLAAVLTAVAADDPLALGLAAGSFRDATRVVALRPDFATAICEANRTALDEALDAAMRGLAAARAADGLGPLFAAAHTARSAWPAPTVPGTLPADDPGLRDRLLDLGSSGGQVTGIDGGLLHCLSPAPSP